MNTGATMLVAPQSGLPRSWKYGGSGRVYGYRPGMTVWSSPALGLVDGRAVLLVGSYDRNIYCLDAATGTRLWSYTTGEAVSATPVLWNGPSRDLSRGSSNGPTSESSTGPRVFATSTDRLVYALDAISGRRLWIHAVVAYRPTLDGARLTAPAIGRAGERDAVFVGHWVWDRSLATNQQEAAVTALDAIDGNVLWRRQLGDNQLTAPIFVVHRGARWLFVGSHNGNLYALDANTGERRWHQIELDAVRGVPAYASTANGPRVIIGSKSGLVRCLDAATGEQAWKYKTGDWVTAAAAVGVARYRQLVFVASYDRTLYALDLLSGTLVWRGSTQGGIFAAPVVIPSTERTQVVATSWDHRLRGFLGHDGSPLWDVYTGRPQWDAVGLDHSQWAAPVAARINDTWMVYHGSYDGTLYGFLLEDLVARGQGSPRSDIGFFISFPIVLLSVSAAAVVLTRRARRRQRNSSWIC